MLGNILYGLTSLFYIGLVLFNFPKPVLTGDRAMGYGLGLFFLGAGFILTSLLLTIHLSWKNAFDWVGVSGGKFHLLIGAGWLSMAAATFFCAVFKWEWHGEYPEYIHTMAKAQAEIWLPLLMLIPALLLLNMERQAGVAPAMVKIPMLVGFAVSVVISLGLLFGWFRDSARQQQAEIESVQRQNDEQHQQHLDYIAEQKPTDPIVNIMALTGRFHDQDVKDAAVAKVKSHPNWEAELLELLENPHYHTEAYTFLDGNKVDHPELFVDPLNRSIRRVASEIKDLIQDSNNLQDWHFEHFGIERLFRAIDEQFSAPGMDFRASVRALRAALDTPKPERFKNVRFTLTPVVDAWLKAHP